MNAKERAANYMKLKKGYNMKQTAVEWLLDNLISEPYSEEDFEHNKECWIKAEKMEKQQIRKAYLVDVYNSQYGFEQYYNETYKK